MKDYDLKYPFFTVRGPFAIVRVCGVCGHTEKVAKGRPGVGRGYGMREGNKARGRMIKHINGHKSLCGIYEIFDKKARKVGEIDIDGWTMRDVLAMFRAVHTNGRRAKYCGM